MNGESGDDAFTVRSFLAIVDPDTGELDYDVGNATLKGGETECNDASNPDACVSGGDDEFQVVDPAEDLPDYVVNSLVDIDGGTGTNRLTIVGTEAGDRYVIQDGAIFGGGLSVKFTNIAFLDASGEEGDDEFVILSTSPSVLLSLYGGEMIVSFMLQVLLRPHAQLILFLSRPWVGYLYYYAEWC